MFHFISPFTYALFVKSFSLINTCPNNSLMIKIRKIHNINLSILSTVMLLGFTFANYKDDKITAFDTSLDLTPGLLETVHYRDIKNKFAVFLIHGAH